jgi:hypothetical protein
MIILMIDAMSAGDVTARGHEPGSAIANTATNGNSVSMSDAALKWTSDANCNSEQFLRRQVRCVSYSHS